MKSDIETEEINYKELDSLELLEYISWKKEFQSEAEKAFTVFCHRYEKDMLKKAEIYCLKFNYNEVVALEVATCMFAKVWKYPTFKIEKAKSKNIDKALIIWMVRILYTQIILYGEKNTCAEPTEEEDLSIIMDIDELIVKTVGDDTFKKKELKSRLEVLESAMLGLSEKHKIILLTYKAYEKSGKNIPRKVSKQLQERLELTQSSIRVYKLDALNHISKYLN
jgi:hypothetical protein